MCALPKPQQPKPQQVRWSEETTVPLFYREERLRLSPTALQLLLARADAWVEGNTITKGSAKGRFLGTAMLTLDLAAAADRLRPPHDEAIAKKLMSVLQEDAALRAEVAAHAIAIARTRLAPPHDLVAGDCSFRVDGARVLIDLDLGSP